MRNEHRRLAGKLEGKGSFGKPVHMQEMILLRGSKAQCNSVEQIYHDGVGAGLSGKVAYMLMKLIVPYLAKHLTAEQALSSPGLCHMAVVSYLV